MAEKDPATAAAEAAAKELVKVAYGDLLQPAAREIGAELGEFVRAIVVAGRGFGALIRETYEPFVVTALQGIPPERRIPPPPPLLGQVLEGISYEPKGTEIYEMFEALIRAASDAGTTDAAHPSYPAIIRQISGDEARILMHLLKEDILGEVWMVEGSDPEFHISKDATLADVNTKNIDFYIDHLTALGLVFTEYGKTYLDQRVIFGGTANTVTVYLQPFGRRFVETCRPRT